jgi:hypothetical protein
LLILSERVYELALASFAFRRHDQIRKYCRELVYPKFHHEVICSSAE